MTTTPLPYFINPWGLVDGDVAIIPQTVQVGGSVSYQQGFGPDYSLPTSNPSWLPVPRVTFNQLMLDVTSAIQQYQQVGVPAFITSVNNGGSAFPYAQYSFAQLGGLNYISLTNANVNTPASSSSSNWRLMDINAQSIIYDSVTFDGSVTQGMAVYFNGTAFFPAVANGTAQANMIGFADVTNARVYATGSLCACGGLITGLTAGTAYYLSTATPGSVTTTPTPVFIGVAYTTTAVMMDITESITGSIAYVTRVYSNTNQSLTGTIANVVVFGSNTFDIGGSFFRTGSVNQFKPQQAGYYRLSATVAVIPVGSAFFSLNFRLNGTTILSAVFGGNNTSNPTATLTDVILFNGSTDFVEVVVVPSVSGTINSGSVNTFLAAELISN